MHSVNIPLLYFLRWNTEPELDNTSVQNIRIKGKTNWKLASLSCYLISRSEAQIQGRCKAIYTVSQEGWLAAII